MLNRIKEFNLNKDSFLYILLGIKSFIEIIVTLMILFKVQVGVFIRNIGVWFTGGNLFIGIVNLIIFMCISIILGQFMLKAVNEYAKKKVNLSTILDLVFITIGFVGAIINVLIHKQEIFVAITKATIVSVGAAVFFAILNAIILITYKKVSERLS